MTGRTVQALVTIPVAEPATTTIIHRPAAGAYRAEDAADYLGVATSTAEPAGD